ncbi:MAG: type II toxin-antitoxin system RelE/ParE family toxin [Dehalococcoidia bacterium]
MRDVAEIAAFIARDSPTAARRLAQRITAAARRAAAFPRSGRVVPESDDDAIREVFVSSYRVIYRILQTDVQVVMVHHGARTLTRVREANPD